MATIAKQPRPASSGQQQIQDDDHDNVAGLNNYKGIYANDDNTQKYQCPITGAHFEVKDLCRRLTKVIEIRKPIEDQIYGPPPQAAKQSSIINGLHQQQLATDMFTSSMVSEKLGQMHQQQITGNNQKNIQFKNKFEDPQPATAAQPYELKPRNINVNVNPNRTLDNRNTQPAIIAQQATGNSRNNKENQNSSYSFVNGGAPSSSSKDYQQLQPRTITQERQPAVTSSKSTHHQAAMDSYSKLMQAMSLKGGQSTSSYSGNTHGLRPKSIDKTTTQKVIAQPIVMKQSQSKVNVTQDYNNNGNGSQSRERQQKQNVSHQMITEQTTKIIPHQTTSSRNNAKGINAQLNTQNSINKTRTGAQPGVSQSFYSNQSALSYQQPQIIQESHQNAQRDSQSSHVAVAQKENNYQRMNAQKSSSQINATTQQRPLSASKQPTTSSERPAMQYSDHITALMRQSNAFGAASGQYMGNSSIPTGTEKTRNNQFQANNARTQQDPRLTTNQQQQQSRPQTGNQTQGGHQKRVSGTGSTMGSSSFDLSSQQYLIQQQQQQTRNYQNQIAPQSHTVGANYQEGYARNSNGGDYLKRLEQQTTATYSNYQQQPSIESKIFKSNVIIGNTSNNGGVYAQYQQYNNQQQQLKITQNTNQNTLMQQQQQRLQVNNLVPSNYRRESSKY